jgi:hypothetical protein
MLAKAWGDMREVKNSKGEKTVKNYARNDARN